MLNNVTDDCRSVVAHRFVPFNGDDVWLVRWQTRQEVRLTWRLRRFYKHKQRNVKTIFQLHSPLKNIIEQMRIANSVRESATPTRDGIGL